MISDQIGDLLTRIRNAIKVRHLECLVSFSKMNENILKVMKENGYILNYQKTTDESKFKKPSLKINLKYKNKISVIEGTKRISKPGLRIYQKSSNLPVVLSKIGVAIISTSHGVMTCSQAKSKKLGGEILAYI